MANNKHKQEHHKESEAERIAREAKEREAERLQALKERTLGYRGVEQGAEMAPKQDVTGEEEHGRGRES